MTDLLCCKKTKVAPVLPKNATLVAPVVVTPIGGPPKEKPYGCVRLYSGKISFVIRLIQVNHVVHYRSENW